MGTSCTYSSTISIVTLRTQNQKELNVHFSVWWCVTPSTYYMYCTCEHMNGRKNKAIFVVILLPHVTPRNVGVCGIYVY